MLMKASHFIRAYVLIEALLKLKAQQYEPPAPPQCANGYLQCHNTCYFLSNKTAPWSDASLECKSLHPNSNLLLLNSKEKDQHFRKCMQNLKFTEELWIDGIFNGKLKRWIWGRTAEPLVYQAFSRRTFNDDSEWKCIVLNPELLYRWSSKDCLSAKSFVCEIEK